MTLRSIQAHSPPIETARPYGIFGGSEYFFLKRFGLTISSKLPPMPSRKRPCHINIVTAIARIKAHAGELVNR